MGGVVVGEGRGHRGNDGRVTNRLISITEIYEFDVPIGVRPMAGGWDDPPIAEGVAFMALTTKLEAVNSSTARAFHLNGDIERGEAVDFVGDEEEVGHRSSISVIENSSRVRKRPAKVG